MSDEIYCHHSIAAPEKKETKCQSYPKLQNQFKLSQAPFTASRPIPSLPPKSENLCFVNNRPPRSLNQSQIQWDGKSLVPESANPFLPAQCTKVKKLLWCTLQFSIKILLLLFPLLNKPRKQFQKELRDWLGRSASRSWCATTNSVSLVSVLN